MMKRTLVAVLLVLAVVQAVAARDEQLPVDPELRIGRLENGMTYYIRHNGQPQGRADFWLVQHTGSLVERDDERGLAHFIEHLAFQGTRHFPGISMVDLLQNNGVSYGNDINASTGFDDTRFKIAHVPTARAALLDTVLLMLKDLASELDFDDRAIEEERRVIEEEWRMHADPTMRMYENTLPILLSGSRYAQRIPIGDMSVVRHVSRSQLLAFYRRWYHPRHQAVVIVGDFDAGHMEQRVRETLGSIDPGACTPIDPQLGHIADHQGITYALSTDPEASSTMVYLMFEHPQLPMEQRNTRAYLCHNVVTLLLQQMLTQRLEEETRTQASPVNYGMVYDRPMLVTRTRDALTMAALVKEGRSLEALDTLVALAARAAQHGFGADELERAKRNAVATYADYQAEADKRTNGEYALEYIDHYTCGGYVPGVVAESRMLIDQVGRITLDEVNARLRAIVGKDNVSVLISGPQSMTAGRSLYPTSRHVIDHFNRIMGTPQAPYIDLAAGDRLLAVEPAGGSIIGESFDPATGVTTMMLGNGATVRLKPTTFKHGEVLFNAFSVGGEWACGDTATVNVRLMDQVVEQCALGGHTAGQLNRMLSGRQLGISFVLNDANEQLVGGCRSNDLETLLQLCYLYFTDVSLDEEAFQALKARLRSQLSQAARNPTTAYGDSIGSTIYRGNPMYRAVKPSDVDALDGQRVLELYRQRVAHAGDYSFSIVGAFDVDEVRPLIRKYLASLPDGGRRETLGSGYRPVMATGQVDNCFEAAMRNPVTMAYVSLMGDKRYSYDDELMMKLVGDAVGAALLAHLRHEKHGTYDVACNGVLTVYHDRWMINYEFETDTALRDSMLIWAEEAVAAVFYSGVSQDLFNKMKQHMGSEHESALSTNDYWLRALQLRALGIDVVGGFEALFPSLTVGVLNNYIAALRPHTRLRIVMN